MSAPSKVLELVDLFRRNADAYHTPQYNEAMVRQEFINPLFKCLGWDMDNEQGYAEAYKDVIHEAAIKIGGATKAPDYCFRIGGAAKFFLEAKRPAVNLKDDPAPAYQLRRYAWTGKLSLSVLTDFEEFAVYDCRVLLPFADAARNRQDQGEYWWELRPCDYYPVLGGPKIIYPDIAKQPRFHLDTDGTFIRNTAYCLDTADPFLLGVLNSRLIWFAISRISIPFGTRAGEYRYRLFTQYIEQLPIRPIDPVDKTAKTRQETMIALVNQQLSLHKQLAAAKTPQDQTVLKRQIDATDRQIDQLVYELYGLTDAEIQIVEAANS